MKFLIGLFIGICIGVAIGAKLVRDEMKWENQQLKDELNRAKWDNQRKD